MMLRIIVAGSRDLSNLYNNHLFAETIIRFRPTEIISGMAKGPDTWGLAVAKQHLISVKCFPADWEKYGKSAGAIRNDEMADYADMLIAYWNGKSRGTQHMITSMLKRNKPFHVELCL